MKLRLPLLLLSCILSIPVTLPATADVIGNGVIYDVGKNHYANDTTVEGYVEDSMQCWAVAGSNVVQYWQDTYYDERDEKFKGPGADVVPFGTIENSPYAPPTGTRYLKVYETELDHMTGGNVGGESYNFFDWWMKGVNNTYNLSGKEAYYSSAFENKDSAGVAYTGLEYTTDWRNEGPAFFHEGEEPPIYVPEGIEEMHVDLSKFIVESFQKQGQAATINLNYGHAITCWGYEMNDSGIVTALILADGDDAQFGAFRATVALEQTDVLDMSAYFGEGTYATYGERLVLKTDDGRVLQLNASYGEDSPKIKTWVSGAARIDTPEEIAKDAVQAESTISAGEVLQANTRLLESKKVTGDGVVVGDGKQAMILTSAKTAESGADIALSLDGATAAGKNTGMTLQEGAMVSLYNLSVENYKAGGIDNGTKMYLHDGKQNISNNTKDGDGAGISNQNYFELQGNTSVVITNNQSTGNEAKGGGIFNGGNATVSIRGNGDVTFSGNTAARGNDIYNSANGIVNIADNGSVTFVGDSGKAAKENVSIVNEGELYLAAKTGDSLTFRNSALETTGRTYIGRDKSDSSPDTAGQVLFTDASGNYTSIRANQVTAQPYAMLEKLNVAATEIMGAGEENGIVSNAIIASLGGMTMKNLTLDTTDSINSLGKSFIEYDNVVLTLNMDDMKDKMFNLTGVFSGNMTMKELTFDLSGTSISGESLSDFTFDLSTAFAEREKMNLMFKTFDGKITTLQEAGSQVLLAREPLPEPTTSTLSLLALAGLAARRRRK